MRVNEAVVERLERVIESLQDLIRKEFLIPVDNSP